MLDAQENKMSKLERRHEQQIERIISEINELKR